MCFSYSLTHSISFWHEYIVIASAIHVTVNAKGLKIILSSQMDPTIRHCPAFIEHMWFAEQRRYYHIYNICPSSAIYISVGDIEYNITRFYSILLLFQLCSDVVNSQIHHLCGGENSRSSFICCRGKSDKLLLNIFTANWPSFSIKFPIQDIRVSLFRTVCPMQLYAIPRDPFWSLIYRYWSQFWFEYYWLKCAVIFVTAEVWECISNFISNLTRHVMT